MDGSHELLYLSIRKIFLLYIKLSFQHQAHAKVGNFKIKKIVK